MWATDWEGVVGVGKVGGGDVSIFFAVSAWLGVGRVHIHICVIYICVCVYHMHTHINIMYSILH